MWKHPPGDEIYRKGSISVFEVDGKKNKVKGGDMRKGDAVVGFQRKILSSREIGISSICE